MKVFSRSALQASVALACALPLFGCGGGDDAGISTTGSAVGSTSGTTAPGTSGSGSTSVIRMDITAAILANQNITLAEDAVIFVPAGTTTYTGVISGKGTIELAPASGVANPGVLVLTQTSTFNVPDAQLAEVSKITHQPHFVVEVTGHNPPAVIIDPGATLQFGTNTSADNSPGIVSFSDVLNPATTQGQVNLVNIQNNGSLIFNTGAAMRIGEVSGTGNVVQLPGAWGLPFFALDQSFTGVLYVNTQANFGISHARAALTKARAVINEGSFIVSAPPDGVTTVPQNIYEAHFGDDINYGGQGLVVMSGVYSYTDNSPHNTPNLVNPGLSDPTLNNAIVVNQSGGPNSANGHDSSYRGINIESGSVQWGDGTHNRFFLPSAPSPAAVNPTAGPKNAYISLRNNSALAFNYNGPVTLNVGITGAGGGPHKDDTLAGSGNVTIMGTPGNDVTFAQPQNYNGTTTIGSGAILRLGSGTPVPLNAVTFDRSGNKSTVLTATYNGDSSLLTAQSSNGAASDAVVNNGQLIVQNTATPITLSNISGAGAFVQAGPSSTTLAGNSYTGGTTVTGGTLLAASANAFGTGDVINSAALQFASSLYELTIGGALRQNAGGTLTLPIDGTSKGVNYGHLTVAGKATLGGTLALNFSSTPLSGQKFVLIDAAGGISGAFSQVTTNGVAVTTGQDGTTFYVVVQ